MIKKIVGWKDHFHVAQLVSATAVFKGSFERNRFLWDERDISSFWEIMTKLNFMCDVVALKLQEIFP